MTEGEAKGTLELSINGKGTPDHPELDEIKGTQNDDETGPPIKGTNHHQQLDSALNRLKNGKSDQPRDKQTPPCES